MHHQRCGLVEPVHSGYYDSKRSSHVHKSLLFPFCFPRLLIRQRQMLHPKFGGDVRRSFEQWQGGGCRVGMRGGCEWKRRKERGAGGRWKLSAYKVAIRRKWPCVRQEEHLCLLPQHTKDQEGWGGWRKTTVSYTSRAPLNTTRLISMVQFEAFRALRH